MLEITNPARIAELAVKMERSGAGFALPLLRAARMGLLHVCMVPAGVRLPRQWLASAANTHPLVLLLQDDGPAPTGPDGFPQARRLMRWARFVLLHAAGGEPGHYGMAVEAALLHRRVLFVETATAHEGAWRALKLRVASRTLGLEIRVRPDAAPHPRWCRAPGEPLQ